MAKLRILVVMMVLLALTLACSGGKTVTPEPRNTPVVTEEPPVTGKIKITIANQSARDICDVRISSTDSESWGDNLLSGKIANGKSKAFTLSAGTYDVIVYDCDDVALASAWSIDANYTLNVGGSGLVEVFLKNDSSSKVCYVYISPVTNDSWGDDWLGAKEGINPGEGRVFFVEPGTYDLLAQDCDENTLAEEDGVEIQSDLTWTLQD